MENQIFQAIREFYKNENYDTISDIPEEKIINFAKAYAYSEIVGKYDSNLKKAINLVLMKYLMLRISKRGKGREQFFKAISNLMDVGQKEHWYDRFLKKP